MTIDNLFSGLPCPSAAEEKFSELLRYENLRIERIVSNGQASPPGFWYDQEQAEWVLLLAGQATLRFENENTLQALSAGDYLLIPAHCRHRVEWTDPEQTTLWLTIHLPEEAKVGVAS